MKCIKCNYDENKGNFCVDCGEPLSKRINRINFIFGTLLSTITTILFMVGFIVLFSIILKDEMKVESKLVEMNKSFILKNELDFSSYFLKDKSVYSDPYAFFSFMENEDWPRIYELLKEETTKDSKASIQTIYDKSGNKLISVINRNYMFGQFSSSHFYIHPVKIELLNESSHTKYFIVDKNNQKTKEVKNKMYVLPGKYDMSLEIENLSIPYNQYLLKEGVLIVGEGKNKNNIDISDDVKNITVHTNFKDTYLYLNGSNMGKFNGNFYELGPMFLNNKIEVFARIKDFHEWDSEIAILNTNSIQTIFSKETLKQYEEYKVKKKENEKREADEKRIKAEQEEAKKLAEERQKEEAERQQIEKEKQEKLNEKATEYSQQIQDFISLFRSDYEKSLNYGDFSYVSDYFNTSLNIYEEYRNEVENVSKIPFYHFTFLSNDITKIEAIEGDKYHVYTIEKFEYVSETESLSYTKKKMYTIYDNFGFNINEIKQLSTKVTLISP